MSTRDTQFQSFAREVVKEILGLRWQTVYYRDPQMLEHYEQIIAHRAYDLVSHTVLNVSISDLDMLSQEECVERIPDLKKWPKEGGELEL